MKKLVYFFMATICLSILASCNGATVYDTYVHTPIAGWEKNDTLSFDVPPLTEGGNYQENLGLRITRAYPFMGLTLIVEQTIFHNKQKMVAESKKDTVNCQLIDKNGSSKGQGISYIQYNLPINVYPMQEGDSIHIAIRHDMKREILPGMSDVGVKISKMK